MSASSEMGYIHGLAGHSAAHEDDAEYMRGYRKGRSAAASGGWRNEGGVLTSPRCRLPSRKRRLRLSVVNQRVPEGADPKKVRIVPVRTLCSVRKHVWKSGHSCDCGSLLIYPTADGSGQVISLVGLSVAPI